jgi:hypothetical protein
MAQVYFYHTNEGPAICFVATPSVNTSTSHLSVASAATVHRVAHQTPQAASRGIKSASTWYVSQRRPKKAKMDKDVDDSEVIVKDVHVLKHDDVIANEAYYLLEHLNRMFSFIYHGLCLERIKFSRFSWIDMDLLRKITVSLTLGIAMPIYSARDIRLRNLDGAYESVMMGKLTRHVIHGVFYHRMLLSKTDQDDQTHCQIDHVMVDDVKAFLFVPISVSVMLSAMQLYLTLILLDVGLMIVTCMTLYYIRMKNGCPLHILASVTQRQERLLSHDELQTYPNSNSWSIPCAGHNHAEVTSTVLF